MERAASKEQFLERNVPLEMAPEEFRAAGHMLVDRIAEFLGSIEERPVTSGESAQTIRSLLGEVSAPENGTPAKKLLEETAKLMLEHSLLNAHPRYWGYITPSPAPIGALGDLLAASFNPNVGARILSPLATEIERQAIRWIAELIGYPNDCGGLLVSGGNMANFVAFIAARKAKASWNVRSSGMAGARARRLRVYASSETHTWIQKATDLFGLGTDSIGAIAVDDEGRAQPAALKKQISEDREKGDFPFLVVGTAGTVSTGAVDPLRELAAICREQGLWFHVDAAYGGFAAVLPDASPELRAIGLADSVAVDPHKWLYAPLEAGCTLVRDRGALHDAFSYAPPYYHFSSDPGEDVINYYDYGPQNSRGFRALKVWLCLRQAGRRGYQKMIAQDIALAKELYRAVSEHPQLEAFSQGLSITTFRYVPRDIRLAPARDEAYLAKLNRELLTRLQKGGQAFVSNAVVRGAFVLRACIVNFRTSLNDVRALPSIVARLGEDVDRELRHR